MSEQLSTMQRIRGEECDKLANATYRSARVILTQDAPPHVAWIPSNFDPYHHLWQYSPMPDTCVLFARKFEPGTSEVATFFESCDMLGLNASCVGDADASSKYMLAQGSGLQRHEAAPAMVNRAPDPQDGGHKALSYQHDELT
jgi:hypothetical protein